MRNIKFQTFPLELINFYRFAYPWFDRSAAIPRDFAGYVSRRVVFVKIPVVLNVPGVDSMISNVVLPALNFVKRGVVTDFWLFRSRFGRFYGWAHHTWYERGAGLASSLFFFAPSIWYLAAGNLAAVPGCGAEWARIDPKSTFSTVVNCNVLAFADDGRSRFYYDDENDGKKLLTLRDIPL